MRWLSDMFDVRPRQIWGAPIDDFVLTWRDPVARGLIKPGPILIDELAVRPALGSDINRVERVRLEDRDWLEQWEATLPPRVDEELPTLRHYRMKTAKEAVEGVTLPMMIEADGQAIGLVTASNTVWGALRMTTLGYWIASTYAGRGITSFAVAAVIDLLIAHRGLNRVEINIRPENEASLALARKLRLRREGYKPKYMCIAGQWADHVAFAIDRESYPEGGLIHHLWGDGKPDTA